MAADVPRGDSIERPCTFSQHERVLEISIHSPSSPEPARELMSISVTARSPAWSGPAQKTFGSTVPESSAPASTVMLPASSFEPPDAGRAEAGVNAPLSSFAVGERPSSLLVGSLAKKSSPGSTGVRFFLVLAAGADAHAKRKAAPVSATMKTDRKRKKRDFGSIEGSAPKRG